IRAVVRAVPRADAAVVDHLVQTFGTVDRGPDRTHQFAGRVLALHAEHHFVVGFGVLEAAAEVGVDADPVHFPARIDLVFADHGNVVLSLTGHDARVTAGAAIEVDRHAPC